MTPEREDFYVTEEQRRASVAKILEPLTDDELAAVYAMFGRDNLKDIPTRYWQVTWQVRAAIKHEQKRRQEAA